MRAILRLIRQRRRFRRLKRDLAHPNLTTAELDELLSDLIHREKHGRDLSHLAPLAAKRGAPDTGPDPLRTHLEQVAEAKRAGAAVPADIDPETYRTGDWKCVDCGLYLTTHPGGGLYCERCARKSAKPGKGRWKLERRARKHDRRRPPLVQYNLPGQ